MQQLPVAKSAGEMPLKGWSMRTFASPFLMGLVLSIVVPTNYHPVEEASPRSCDIPVTGQMGSRK